MKINELNKKNILDIDNNLDSIDNARNQISSFPELGFEILVDNGKFKIYKEEHSSYTELYVITDISNDVLHWIYVFDYLGRYETKYEYIFIGNAYNYHINKRNGKLNQYATR